jgi:polyvinyl alcohol dehydrogenase (cytochrome)
MLSLLSGTSIVAALEHGLMSAQGAGLTPDERIQVAEYLTGAPIGSNNGQHAPPACTGSARSFDASSLPAPFGWGYDNARFVPTNIAGVDTKSASRLELKWALAFPSAIRARSQPHIAYGAVYVGSQDGTVYALDLKTGCARWMYRAAAEVRTAIVPMQPPASVNGADRPRVFFGDVIGRLYSLDAFTGKLAWSVKLDEHPSASLTGAAALHEGVLYAPVSSLEEMRSVDPQYECCTFRGSVVALDAWTGKQKWKSYTITTPLIAAGKTVRGTKILAPSGAPVFSSPTVDAGRGVLYIGTGDNYSSPADERSDAVLAFRLSDGKLLWSRQLTSGDAWNLACALQDQSSCPAQRGPDWDLSASILLRKTAAGRDLLIAGQKSGVVYALDPERAGAIEWQTRVGRGGIQGGVHFGMAVDADRIYVPISDMRDTSVAPSQPSDPKITARPGLHALDLASGRILWSALAANRCADPSCDPGISAAVTAAPGVIFAGHLDGMFRAYDSASGAVLFNYDTHKEFKTVSGDLAQGGSISGAGPAVRDGYVIVNSGYGFAYHMPGHVLLVFAAHP